MKYLTPAQFVAVGAMMDALDNYRTMFELVENSTDGMLSESVGDSAFDIVERAVIGSAKVFGYERDTAAPSFPSLEDVTTAIRQRANEDITPVEMYQRLNKLYGADYD